MIFWFKSDPASTPLTKAISIAGKIMEVKYGFIMVQSVLRSKRARGRG
jgi:hypothetical protein